MRKSLPTLPSLHPPLPLPLLTVHSVPAAHLTGGVVSLSSLILKEPGMLLMSLMESVAGDSLIISQQE